VQSPASVAEREPQDRAEREMITMPAPAPAAERKPQGGPEWDMITVASPAPPPASVPAHSSAPEREPQDRAKREMITMASAEQVDPPAPAEDMPFPVPLVIGEVPKLGSQPRGLPGIEGTVPDTVLDGADLSGLTVRGASLRGDEHRYMTETRQDSMGIWELADRDTTALLACVADGVGSQPLSHRGSAEACRLLRDEAQQHLTALLDPGRDDEVPQLCQTMAVQLAQRLDDMARRLTIAPKSLSTTLVGALVQTGKADLVDPAHRRCVIFAIGDSPVFLLRDGTFRECLADSHDGVIADTRTAALPTSIGTVGTRVLNIGPDDMLVVCSDGLSNPMRNKEVSDRLGGWWSRGDIPGLPEFGWQLSFRAKSFGDDRTAICVWGR
jgi:serine/threonine protein phosphatase PrpC